MSGMFCVEGEGGEKTAQKSNFSTWNDAPSAPVQEEVNAYRRSQLVVTCIEISIKVLEELDVQFILF